MRCRTPKSCATHWRAAWCWWPPAAIPGREERYYPAAHDGVIAVGAVDDDLRPASFSTRGAHVALCAPGRGIWTCGLDGLTARQRHQLRRALRRRRLRAAGRPRRTPRLAAGPGRSRATCCAAARAPSRAAGVDGCGSGVLDVVAALRALDQRIDDGWMRAGAGQTEGADDGQFQAHSARQDAQVEAPDPLAGSARPAARRDRSPG